MLHSTFPTPPNRNRTIAPLQKSNRLLKKLTIHPTTVYDFAKTLKAVNTNDVSLTLFQPKHATCTCTLPLSADVRTNYQLKLWNYLLGSAYSLSLSLCLWDKTQKKEKRELKREICYFRQGRERESVFSRVSSCFWNKKRWWSETAAETFQVIKLDSERLRAKPFSSIDECDSR